MLHNSQISLFCIKSKKDFKLAQHIISAYITECNSMLLKNRYHKAQKEVVMADIIKTAMLYSTLIITINALVVVLALIIETH